MIITTDVMDHPMRGKRVIRVMQRRSLISDERHIYAQEFTLDDGTTVTQKMVTCLDSPYIEETVKKGVLESEPDELDLSSIIERYEAATHGPWGYGTNYVATPGPSGRFIAEKSHE
jgi:hypothetical protein